MNITEESKEFETPQIENIQEAIESLKNEVGDIYRLIPINNEEVRLFQSYSPKRLKTETYYEYKVRQYILREGLKAHKRHGYSRSDIPVQ